MQNSGKFLIISIFGISLAMAIFAWWFQFQRGRRVLELWGSDNAKIIRIESDRVDLFFRTLPSDAPLDDSAESVEVNIAGQSHIFDGQREITNARGLVHARQALIEDATFLWDKARGDCQADWQYLLRFSSGQQSVDIAVDTSCDRLRLLGSQEEVAIAPKIASALTGVSLSLLGAAWIGISGVVAAQVAHAALYLIWIAAWLAPSHTPEHDRPS